MCSSLLVFLVKKSGELFKVSDSSKDVLKVKGWFLNHISKPEGIWSDPLKIKYSKSTRFWHRADHSLPVSMEAGPRIGREPPMWPGGRVGGASPSARRSAERGTGTKAGLGRFQRTRLDIATHVYKCSQVDEDCVCGASVGSRGGQHSSPD